MVEPPIKNMLVKLYRCSEIIAENKTMFLEPPATDIELKFFEASTVTLPKTNIAPEKGPSQKESTLPTIIDPFLFGKSWKRMLFEASQCRFSYWMLMVSSPFPMGNANVMDLAIDYWKISGHLGSFADLEFFQQLKHLPKCWDVQSPPGWHFSWGIPT